MQKPYLVHSAHDTSIRGTATLADGSEADVTYHCFKVELVADGHDSGTWSLEFHGAEMAWAREHFIPGSQVLVPLDLFTFTLPVDGNDN